MEDQIEWPPEALDFKLTHYRPRSPHHGSASDPAVDPDPSTPLPGAGKVFGNASSIARRTVSGSRHSQTPLSSS